MNSEPNPEHSCHGANLILLALETSTRQPTAAIFRDGCWLQTTVADNAGTPGSARFPVQVKDLLQFHNISPWELDTIAVSIGPGSFTGLRIGAVLAKTWGWATQCSLVAVDTLESIAMCAIDQHGIQYETRVHVVVDSHRDQLFHGLFQFSKAGVVKIQETEIIDVCDVLTGVETGDWLVGPGLLKQKVVDQTKSGIGFHLAPIIPDARLVGNLALQMVQAGHLSDPFSLVPQYVRPSAAEEKTGPVTGPPA